MSDIDAATARALSKRVGVLGGGQLGRMMALAAHRLGVRVTVLDPGGDDSPAGQVCRDAIAGAGARAGALAFCMDLFRTCLPR